MSKGDGYNGYSNRETWAVALHLGTSEGVYRYWQEAKEQVWGGEGPDETAARWALEDMLREWWGEWSAQVEGVLAEAQGLGGLAVLATDLWPGGEEIEWREVAESIIGDGWEPGE